MPLFEDYATNHDVESEGAVRDFGDFWIKLARAGGSNKKYSKALRKTTAPYNRAIDLGKLPDELANKLMVTVYAEAVVLDWGGDGMVDPDGQPLPCTKENVVRVLTELPDLFAEVRKAAEGMELFQQANRERTGED